MAKVDLVVCYVIEQLLSTKGTLGDSGSWAARKRAAEPPSTVHPAPGERSVLVPVPSPGVGSPPGTRPLGARPYSRRILARSGEPQQRSPGPAQVQAGATQRGVAGQGSAGLVPRGCRCSPGAVPGSWTEGSGLWPQWDVILAKRGAALQNMALSLVGSLAVGWG